MGGARVTGPSRAGAESEVRALVPDVDTLAAALDSADYLADPGLGTALFLAVRLPQPLLLEGEPGVGKTEAAKALARVLDTPLYRLQCFEGIDAAEALYEWNHPRQLLGIRLAEARGAPLDEDDLFGPGYLLRRPLLQAIEHPGPRPAVLLLDEIDRGDAQAAVAGLGQTPRHRGGHRLGGCPLVPRDRPTRPAGDRGQLGIGAEE